MADPEPTIRYTERAGKPVVEVGGTWTVFSVRGIRKKAEKALQAAGNGPLAKDVLYEMGGLCEEQGRRETALQHYTRILEQDIGYRDVAQRVDRLKAG